jgi:RNA polymerase sigma-70 factor, ECF subfamily
VTTPKEQQGAGVPARLGDVLYADGTVGSPEAEWAALVRAIAAGDQLALRDLYERTHRIVYTLVVRIVDHREAAEELTLDVYHDVWRRASSYDPDGGPVIGWIMNQARSRAIDRLRFQQRKKRVDPYPEDAISASTHTDPLPEETRYVQQQAQIVRDALTQLTPEERRVIECAFFAELTYAEVAERLSQPLGTVKTRIRSALSKLRAALGGGVAEP